MSEHPAGQEPQLGAPDAGELIDRIIASLDAARADLVSLSRTVRPTAPVPLGTGSDRPGGGIAPPEDTAAGRGEPALPPPGIDSTDTAVHPDPRESRQARPDQP